MAGKKVSLTPQGHRVQGALATYLVPLLAADQALDSNELRSLCKSITPARFDKQIEGIVGTVKERFGARLAQDADLNNLRKILTALMPPSLAMDKAAMDDDDGEDALPPAFLKNIKKKKKAEDSAEEDPEDDDSDDFEDEDEDDDKDGDKPSRDEKAAAQTNSKQTAEGDQDNEEEGQWVKPTKSKRASNKPISTTDDAALDAALDLAMDTARREGAALAEKRIGAKFEAADAVKAIVGKVNVFACDSAADIYKMALDAKGVDVTGVPRVAYKHLLREVLKRGDAPTPVNKFAQDAAVTKSLADEFPVIPARV
jgi:hypothetical protein